MKRPNFGSKAKKAYDAATDLWFASGVEGHAEGHPGVPGPARDEPWDYERAHLDAAIHTLTLIRERLYLAQPQPTCPTKPQSSASGR
jgi:hypothetical protein